MTVNGEKTIAERQFDILYSRKPVIGYDFDTGKMGSKDRKIMRYLLNNGIEGKRCLDVGPGTGRWLQFLKNRNAGYLGAIDISHESLRRCSPLCNKTQKADLEADKFDFESDFFDIVISIEVLEHLRDPATYLTEILRVVKKGGIVLMSIPNVVSFISRVRMLFGILPAAIGSDRTHVGFYRKKDIVRLLAPFNMRPKFIPTSISLNPLSFKSRFRIPSFNLISSFDDSLLFLIRIEKK